MENKKYILQKDLPDAKAGDEFIWNETYKAYYHKGNTSLSYWLKEYVENNPEWFKEEIQRDWEILEFKKGDQILEFKNGKYRNDFNSISLQGCFDLGIPIHMVRRLSDGVVFSVGDLTNYGTIKEFKILQSNQEMRVVMHQDFHMADYSFLQLSKLLPKKERVEVVFKQLYWDKIRNSVTDTGMNYHYDVWSNIKISEDKFKYIKQAIESCLNGEDEYKIPLSKVIEEIERKAFEAERKLRYLATLEDCGIRYILEKHASYPTYENYKQSEQPEKGIE